MRPFLRLAAAVPLVGLLLAAQPARADLFSPGDLSRYHADLEGLSACAKCHVEEAKVSADACLGCHKELQARVVAGKGLHGLLPPEKRACQTCHREHLGRTFKLIDWGAGGKKGFDHARAGWPLVGKHRPVDCARCHDPRLIGDVSVQKVIEKGRATSLGAPTACAACHTDEHRGQLAGDCARCHGTAGWKPAKFDHATAAYKLDGLHLKVACAKCHADQPAAALGDLGGKTAPVRAALSTQYKKVPFQSCGDCHKKDPHQGRFGEACASCHVTAGWKQLHGSAREAVFHEKTKYPLRGAHVQARCEACHGPFAGEPARYRDLKFGKCSDCHFDAHVGQFTAPPPPAQAGKTCDRCHTVESYQQPRFELEDHQRLPYQLEGAHQVVACSGCHPKDPRLEARVPAATRQRLEAQRRPVKVALTLYTIPKAAKDCRTCHRDPHGGQFQARVDKDGCVGCHVLATWHQARFDHQRDSRFKLAGKHEKAACASCHRPGDAGAVRYKPLALECAGCHADPHAGQFAVKGRTDCARCHDAASWKEKVRFDHQQDSRFKLEGKHKPLACEKCHAVVAISKGVEARRYKPLPLDCQGCHADFHQGAFKGFQP